MEIFNSYHEKGDILFPISEIKDGDKLLTLENLCKVFESSGYPLFSLSRGIPHLQEKIEFELFKEEDLEGIAVKLAPFLGLPGENLKAELDDLKSLLTWVKDKAFQYPDEDLRLVLDSIGEKADLELRSNNKEFQKELNKELMEKINSSSHLTKWLENQKIGILNIKGKLFDLFAVLSVEALMSEEEIIEYYKLKKPKPNQCSQLRKRQRYN